MLNMRTLVCFLAFAAIATQVTGKVIGENKAEAGFVEIGNHTYYWDPTKQTPPQGKALCASLNMNCIIFETPQKFEEINEWLARDYATRSGWYLTDGYKYTNQETWYWQSTVVPITDFYWGSAWPFYADSYWKDLVLILASTPTGIYYMDVEHTPAPPRADFMVMCQ